jgi:hypothetical protein
MSLIPLDNYKGYDQFIYVATSSQLTQPVRRGRSSTARRGRGGRSAAGAAALPPNNPQYADNVSINLQQSFQPDHLIPADLITISRQELDDLRNRLLILELSRTFHQPEVRSTIAETDPLADQFDQFDDSYKSIPRHIIKLLNSESFSGSDGQFFDIFEEQVRNKLEVNHWMFPDKRARFAWLISLLTGDARSILNSHLKHHNPL